MRRIETSWRRGLIATHTLNRAGGFDAIDGRLWWRNGKPFPGTGVGVLGGLRD